MTDLNRIAQPEEAEEESCLELLDEAVAAHDGILDVELDTAAEKVTFAYDPRRVDEGDIARLEDAHVIFIKRLGLDQNLIELLCAIGRGRGGDLGLNFGVGGDILGHDATSARARTSVSISTLVFISVTAMSIWPSRSA